MSIKLSFLIFFAAFTYTNANHKLDSLVQELKQSKSSEKKLEIYQQIYRTHTDASNDSVLFYLQGQNQLAIKVGNKAVAGKSHFSIGLFYKRKGDYNLAIDNYIKATRYFRELNMYKYYAYTLNNLGTISILASNYESAINFFNKAIVIHRHFEQNKYLVRAFWNIGYCQMKLEKYDLSEAQYQQALGLSTMLDNHSFIYKSYNYLGELAANQCHYERARLFYNNASAIIDPIDDLRELSIIYNNIGGTYFNEKNLAKAENYYLKSIDLKESFNDHEALAVSYRHLGELKINQQKMDEGLSILGKAIDLSNKDIINTNLTEALTELRRAYELTMEQVTKQEIIEVIRQWENQHKKLSDLKRRLESMDIQNTLSYHITLDKKETELASAKAAERRNLWILAATALALLITIFVLYRTYRYYRRAKTTLIQISVLTKKAKLI